MRTVRIAVSALALTMASVQSGQAQGNPTIDQAEVERIISTLASDEMLGRATFSPGNAEAAAFLQEEFAAIGLEPLDGLNSHEQAFQMYRVTPESGQVVLNGEELAENQFAVSVSAESVQFTSRDAEVIRVGPTDDIGAVFSRVNRAEGNVIVLVNQQHIRAFAGLRNFVSRPSSVMELGGSNVAWILTSEETANVEVTVESTIEVMDLMNVAGMIPGRRSDEIVLFSAHYDHIGIRPPVNGDSIANGANDDASGTTAVVLLAKYFKSLGQPERTLMFVAFTGEEVGGYGSRYFSNQLDPDQIVAMFNIEMIGKPATSGPNSAWITGWDRSDFGQILQRAVEGTMYEFYADPYPDQNLFYRSDNATLARLGVPAHSISTTPIDVDQDYHQVSDEVATLDLEHLTNTIGAIAAGAETIVTGTETPTRVDASQVN